MLTSLPRGSCARSRGRCARRWRRGPRASTSVGGGVERRHVHRASSWRHSGSSVPLTRKRFSARSAVEAVASAAASVCRRVAASACACTMSSGASVPTSTRAWLSSTRRSRQRQRPPGDVHGAAREDQVPVGVADVGDGLRDGGPHARSEISRLMIAICELLPGVVDPEAAKQRLGEGRGEGRRVARVEVGDRFVGDRRGVVEADREVAAAPRRPAG